MRADSAKSVPGAGSGEGRLWALRGEVGAGGRGDKYVCVKGEGAMDFPGGARRQAGWEHSLGVHVASLTS